jgi:hypothetical protein
MAGCDDAIHPPAQTYARRPSDHLCRRASMLTPPALMARYEGETEIEEREAGMGQDTCHACPREQSLLSDYGINSVAGLRYRFLYGLFPLG